MRVDNGGDDAVELELYVGGATVTAGHLQFEDRAGDASDLTRWASVKPDHLTVPAGATADAHVDIAVPEDAPDGERLGVIWAQTTSAGEGTNVVNRVGVRVYLSVGSGAAPSTDFRVDALTPSRDASGAAVLTASITNTGGRSIEPTGTVSIDGDASAPAPVAPGLALLAGQRGDAGARLTSDVDEEPVRVVVDLAANGVEHHVEATVTFPAEASATASPVVLASDAREDDRSRTAPAILAALLAAAVLAGALRARQRRLPDRS